MHAFFRTLRWSFWLGWQIESNWAHPWLFAGYVLVKPLTGTLLFVAMFQAALSNDPTTSRALLAFTYLGNALYMFAGAVGFGMSTTLVADREHYGMLKYWRICPIDLQVFLYGRGLANGARGMLGALLTIAVGLLLPFGLREHLGVDSIAWGWLLFHLVVGTVLLLGVGLMLAGAVLNMARHGMFLSEGVGTALYLLSGAIFPLSVLPGWLQSISLALPHTYWMEGLRQALLGHGIPSGPLASWTQPELAAVLVVSTGIVFALGQWIFRVAERRASRLGRYDYTTGF